MTDPRVQKLARLLIRYSLNVKKGQVLLINSPAVAAPLVREAYREAILAGAYVETAIALDGLDEITVTGRTRVCELRDGRIKTYELDAERLFDGCADARELAGGDAAENAAILRGILDGSVAGAKRNVALINAAAAIVAGEKADRIEDALTLAEKSLDSGAARNKLEQLIKATT